MRLPEPGDLVAQHLALKPAICDLEAAHGEFPLFIKLTIMTVNSYRKSNKVSMYSSAPMSF